MSDQFAQLAVQLISLVISMVGFIAVVISLYLSRRQTKEMISQSRSIAESLNSTTFQNIVTETSLFDQQLIAHPEVRPYFFDGIDINETDSHYSLVAAFCDYMLDYFDFLLLQSRQFPQVFPSDIWKAFIKDRFSTSPVLRRYLASESVQTWYSTDLLEILRSVNM